MRVLMNKTRLGVLGLSVAAVALTLFAVNVSAETATKPPACNTLKEEAACKERADCSWVAAVVDSKTGKQKRRAYCRKKPASKKK
jgi:hypothetical protein